MPIKPLTRLLFAQGGLCFFCKQPLPVAEASIEHLVASSNGGSDNDANCVACCKDVNALLGAMALKEKIQLVLNQKGVFKCPNGAGTNGNGAAQEASSKQASPPQAKLESEYARLVANLKQRGDAKPRTVRTLKSSIAHLFQNKLSSQEVNALVQQLRARRQISIAGSKITYA